MCGWRAPSWLLNMSREERLNRAKRIAETNRIYKEKARKIEAELKLEFGDDFDEWHDTHPRSWDKSLEQLSLRLAYGEGMINRYRKPFVRLADVEKEVRVKQLKRQ